MPSSPPTPITPIGRNASSPQSAVSDVGAILQLQIGVVVIAALYLAREVLIPITLAVLLSFVLAPLAGLLRRIGLGRVPSVLLAVIVALGIISAIGTVIGTQVAQLAADAPRYAQTIEGKVQAARQFTVGRITAITDKLGRHEPPAGQASAPAAPQAAAAQPAQGAAPTPTPTPAPSAIESLTNSPLELAEKYLSPVLSPLETLGIVLVVTIFVLLQQEDLRDRLIRIFGATDLHRTTAALDDAGGRLSRYFLAQLGINGTFGVVIGIGLFFIGVPNPILWAILSALLRFVPYVGAFLSAGLPIALAAAVDPGWSMVVWTAALYVVVELLTGQVVEPLLYGHSTGLSPLAVIVSAIFWSWLWGPIGLILSMPLTLCVVVLGRYVDRLEFLDVLLGDRPALTPVESFYQRILAGDSDEAQDSAELLLKERSLMTYYDDVALKGLQLAAHDAERGVLDRDGLERVRNTTGELITALASHDDVPPTPEKAENRVAGAPADQEQQPNPPPVPVIARDALPPGWSSAAPVLCLAGRGPLDEAASAMLVQLLGKHGLGAWMASYESASRASIANLDVDGVAMVCISYLDISGSPSHLRYLLRRLRQKAPNARILVGLWPAEDKVLSDAALRTEIGADDYTTSLRGAVEACLAAAQGGKALAAATTRAA